MPPPPTAPTSTYRLQLRSGLTLDTVRTDWLAPLVDLGVSHLYLSPVFRAAEGSTHGYDVVDADVVDESLGSFEDLCRAAHDAGLGVVVDLVPNHMATDHDRNERWWDLLRNGPASPSATWFDLDWDTPERRLRGQLLLPVLPDHYGRELERGAFGLAFEHRLGHLEPVLVHPSATTPLELRSLVPVLRPAGLPALDRLLDDIDALPDWSLPHDPDELVRRHAEEPSLRHALNEVLVDLLEDDTAGVAIRHALDATAADVEALDALIEAQPYRPARWQTSLEDLSYRRFFDINTLVGVRVDRPEVFDATHRLVRRWVDEGLVDGLRVDHVDGLRDPAGYLERLRSAAPRSWILVEKILEGDEALPSWPIDGTTGYEAGELIGRLELDDEGRPVLERLAASHDGATDVGPTLTTAKLDVLDELLSADLNRITESLLRVCERRRRFRDVTRRELHQCLRLLLTRMPVYRTYVRPGREPGGADQAIVAAALEDVSGELADVTNDGDPEILELLRILLLGGAETALEWDFVLRFQQLSGPTMAKGAEDTAWYRLPALISRCEVGSDPGVWGLGLDAFHDAMADRQRHWPLALTATTTHDSKRTEDVRVRLSLLTQDADAWAELVESWECLLAAAPDSPPIAGTPAGLHLLQSMVGAWPIDADRLVEHMVKATREAKIRTSWLRPDVAYEEALESAVRAVSTSPEVGDLVEGWVAGHAAAEHAAVLAQKLLALTVPGVPDLYQGSEDVLLRLTDPDNRHPVVPPQSNDATSSKRALVRTALRVRREHVAAFGADGGYEPLWASGPRADHAVAFVRGGDVITVAPRRVMAVADGWRGTTLALPEGTWRDELTSTEWTGTVDLDELLSSEPVALLSLIR